MNTDTAVVATRSRRRIRRVTAPSVWAGGGALPDVTRQVARDHQRILAQFEVIRAAAIRFDLQAGQMLRMRELVLRHRVQTDQAIYAPLLEHPASRALAAGMQPRMQAMTRTVMAFFLHYLCHASDGMPLDFVVALSGISERVRVDLGLEAQTVFPEYRVRAWPGMGDPTHSDRVGDSERPLWIANRGYRRWL